MERKIGEIFEYDGNKLRVEACENSECSNCYFAELCPNIDLDIVGNCESTDRQDKSNVKFIAIEKESELNLCEILKDCPEGWEFYSSNVGNVKFVRLDLADSDYPIIVKVEGRREFSFTKEGWYWKGYTNAECTLFPSKNQRDWSKFTAPWYKNEKFDPNTLKPFDKVLVRDTTFGYWECEFFSHHIDDAYPYVGITSSYKYCIPYNDETKHLVGTTDEAPEFYKYWED